MQASGVQYGLADVSQFMVGIRGPSPRVHNIFQVSSSSSDQQQYSSHQQQQQQQQHHVPKNHQQQLLRQQEHLKDQMVATEKVGEGTAYNSPCKQLEPSPISAGQQLQAGNISTDKASSSGVAAGGDDDVFGGGEDCERLAGAGGGSAGNRWPREETLALLKIRSEMDANFRDASLKGPLWKHVSRRLEELGYHRDPKKCKEKFENIHKYYKRSKEGRVGRQDGKSYRFFDQLEALYSSNNSKPPYNSNKAINDASTISNGDGRVQAQEDPISSRKNEDNNNLGGNFMVGTTSAANTDFNSSEGISFSSDSSEDYDEPRDSNNKKRKRSGTKKLMAFFENFMKQMMEKQEKMQQKFLEAIEKRENDRMIREEAWKRQEMARLNRDQELRSQERSVAASRDLALVSFLQKFTGQLDTQLVDSSQIPNQGDQEQEQEQDLHDEQDKDLSCTDPNSKRWPKSEVIELIKARSGMGPKFQETGPKGPLWEDISTHMTSLGYKRSAKRCKEKWENINKYYKKTKEGNKKRPENSKTCPYFHQLDALYRKGMLSNLNKVTQMHDEDNQPDDEDHQEELLEQVSGSNIREDSAQGQGADGDGDGEILPVRPPPPPHCSAPSQTPTSNAPATLFSTPESRNADNGSLTKAS